MKHKNRKVITGALTSAVCTLLGFPESQAQGAGWKIDTAYLSYSEKDRVKAAEPTVKIQKTFKNDSKLNLNIVYDTLSGPSPNGAAPSNVPQTFSGPSGGSSTSIKAGVIPMDSNFQDTREQFGASWDALLNRLTRYNLGFNTSTEHDYDSVSISAGLSREFNKKNTTLSSGISYAHDKVTPAGGIPDAAKPMLAGDAFHTISGASGGNATAACTYTSPSGTCITTGSGQGYTGEDDDDDEHENDREAGDDDNEGPGENIHPAATKNVIDVYVGLGQVINPQTLMQFTVGFSKATGYLNDPYKVVSIVDAVTGVPLTVAEGGIIYENRPDSRFKTSLFWNTRYHLDRGDTVGLSYRFMFDDWGINSHTVDVSYRWNMSEQFYLQPHARWYTQNAADFYRQSISNAEGVPYIVSADSRLAALDATTIGAKFGYKPTPQSELNIRMEKYVQYGKKPENAIGIQAVYDTFPALEATILQVGYSISF